MDVKVGEIDSVMNGVYQHSIDNNDVNALIREVQGEQNIQTG